MAQKTWKLGEVCRGGVITVVTTKNSVTVIGKEWDSSKGFNKNSDQSNAQEFTRKEVSTNDGDAEWKLDCFINDLTTSYYTDQILTWIKSKTSFNKYGIWR